MSNSAGGSFWGYFLAYFYASLFLENDAIFYHEIVLSSTPMITSPKEYVQSSFARGHFGVFLSPCWHMFLYFLKTIQYFLMKFCRYYTDGHYTNQKNNLKNFRSCSLLPGHFGMFLPFLRTIQYFPMKMCTDVLGTTLMVNPLFLTWWPFLLGAIFRYFWAYFFMFLYF